MMTDQIEITDLSVQDDWYHYCLLLKQLTSIEPEMLNADQFKKQLEIIQANPNHRIIVAKYQDQIVGTTTILIEPKIIHNLSKVAHVEDVVVDNAYRSMGIGKKLMQKAKEIAQNHSCYKIILDCSDSNIPFYLKCLYATKERQMVQYL